MGWEGAEKPTWDMTAPFLDPVLQTPGLFSPGHGGAVIGLNLGQCRADERYAEVDFGDVKKLVFEMRIERVSKMLGCRSRFWGREVKDF